MMRANSSNPMGQTMSNPTPNTPANVAAQLAAKAKAAAQNAEASEAENAAVDSTTENDDEQLAKAWGFAVKRPQLSKSTVIAVATIVALLGVFGYVVVKNFRGRAEPVAEKPVEDADVKPASATDSLGDKAQQKKLKDEMVALDELNGQAPTNVEPNLEDELGINGEPTEPALPVTSNKKQALPRNLDSEFDTFGDEPQPLAAPKTKVPAVLADDMPEFDTPAEPQKPARPAPAAAPSLSLDEEPSDSLEQSPRVITRNSEPARLEEPMITATPADEGFSEPIPVTKVQRADDEFAPVPQKTQKPIRVARRDEFAETNFDNVNTPAPATTNLPAPRTQATQKSAAGRHPLLNDGEYLVEEGDNFCVISKKLYGSEKYYLALAQHNRNRVADPCRMRPGLIIAAPSREVLESQHATLIPKAKVEVEANGEKPHAAKKVSAAPLPSGLYFDQQGAPWYRVGKGDTLQGIARAHLGRISRAEQIFNLNRERLADPDDLRLGQELRLPSDASQVRLVEAARSLQ